MATYSSDPREVRVRYTCTCAETGRTLKRGDLAVYYPTSRLMYHPDSKQAQEFRNWRADVNAGTPW